MNLPQTPDELEAYGRENWARLMFLKEETRFLERFRSEQIKQAQDHLASLPDSKAAAFQSRLASKRIVLSDEGYESKGTGVAPTAASTTSLVRRGGRQEVDSGHEVRCVSEEGKAQQ